VSTLEIHMVARIGVPVLAVLLTVLPAPFRAMGSAEARVVRVAAAADEEFRQGPEWRDGIARALARAGQAFAEFDIEFRVEDVVAWDSSARDHDLSALHDELGVEVPAPDADLVVGFVGSVGGRSDRRFVRLGHSDTPGRYLVVSDRAGRDLWLVLRHELGHAFGLPHIAREPSVMSEGIDGGREAFDRVSAAILRNNARLEFGSVDPFAGCDLDRLESHYRKLADRGEVVADLLGVVGDSHRTRGRWDEADRLYRLAGDLDSGLVSARLGRAMVALARNRHAEAIALLEAVQASDPDIDGLDTSLGVAYAGIGAPGSAQRAYERAVRRDPGDAAAWNNLGLLYVEGGRQTDAEDALRRALAARPRFHEAWNNLGLLFQRQERYAEAREAFAASLALRETAIAHRNLGSALLALNRREEAREHFAASLRLDPDQDDADRLTRLAGRDE
jgi:tetratricopeptide (TPR) repeat protein